jgi:hypothetical protein
VKESLIDSDGSYEEGGGQMLETSLALSAILRKPIAIHYIRSLLRLVSCQRNFLGAKGESRSEGFTGIPSG